MEKNQENQENHETSFDTIKKTFSSERLHWKAKIQSMSAKLKQIETLHDLEIDAYSSRQIALEYMHTLMFMLSKINAKLRKLKKSKLLFYTEQYDLKLDKEQKNMFIAVDFEKTILYQELLNNHFNYFKGTIDSIDKIIYGIKWRIQIEELKRQHQK